MKLILGIVEHVGQLEFAAFFLLMTFLPVQVVRCHRRRRRFGRCSRFNLGRGRGRGGAEGRRGRGRRRRGARPGCGESHVTAKARFGIFREGVAVRKI